ncbi:MAG: hypothetical protein V8T87_11005, partial [Victivallales bacterium]
GTRIQKILIPVFETLALHAERQGFQIYFHCTDEPDIHPDTVPAFEKFCRMLRNRTALKIASNATPAGVRKWEGLLDLNLSAAYNGVIDGWLGKGYVNPFYRQWGECPPEYVREHCRYSYVQVRSRNPLSARADFGFYCDAMNLKGMWGFAYYFGQQRLVYCMAVSGKRRTLRSDRRLGDAPCRHSGQPLSAYPA